MTEQPVDDQQKLFQRYHVALQCAELYATLALVALTVALIVTAYHFRMTSPQIVAPGHDYFTSATVSPGEPA